MKHAFLPTGMIGIHADTFYKQSGTFCTLNSTLGHKSFTPTPHIFHLQEGIFPHVDKFLTMGLNFTIESLHNGN